MTPRFQFTLARMLAAITCLAVGLALLRFLFVEPRLFGILALLSSLTLMICAVAILARGREGFLWALVVSIVSCTLCLFVYLLFYTLFFDLPRDIRRGTGRRRVITMAPPAKYSRGKSCANAEPGYHTTTPQLLVVPSYFALIENYEPQLHNDTTAINQSVFEIYLTPGRIRQ